MKPTSIFGYVTAPAPRYLMRLSLIQKMLGAIPIDIKRFLEIGPGMGDLSLYLIDLFPGVLGDIFDISKSSINIVEQRNGGQDRLQLHNADFVHSNFTISYDLIIACEVFEHIEDDGEAFDKVRQLLKPEGYFLFSAPAFMANWGWADTYAGHARRYEREKLQLKFKLHGFEIIYFWVYGYPVTHWMGPLTNSYYRMVQQRGSLSRMESTKRSGTARAIAGRFPTLPVSNFMRPFFWMQDKIKESNRGDGFLVLASKIP